MFQNLNVFRSAQGLSIHASRQQAQIAVNIANADTPGYRAAHVREFNDAFEGISLRHSRAGHLSGSSSSQDSGLIKADVEASPNGNNVSLEEEMVASVAASRDHERALAIYRHGLTMLRAGLGRR